MTLHPLRFAPALLPIVLAAAPGAQGMSSEQFVEEARSLVLEAAERDEFSGTVLVADGDEVLLTMAVGEASKRFHVPNDVETCFNLGSMNKMFTAVAVSMLAEQDKLSFDDPISMYVDESWLPRETTERITVHHLLTHTSGLGSYFNRTYITSSREMFVEVDDYKPLVQGDTLAFEPGASYRYSNTGMLLLGVVIEKASGQNYFEFVQEHIHRPTGMTRTACYRMDEPVENLAIGYERNDESSRGWRNNIYQHVLRGGPAGGGFSTVGDLHRFAMALLDGELLSVESLERLWTDHPRAGYGYGFGISNGLAGKVVGHGGGFSGISSNLDILLDRGFIIAVMSNYSGAARPIATHLQSLAANVD